MPLTYTSIYIHLPVNIKNIYTHTLHICFIHNSTAQVNSVKINIYSINVGLPDLQYLIVSIFAVNKYNFCNTYVIIQKQCVGDRE
jgi:hypothetical protein